MQSQLSRSLPPTPSHPHGAMDDDDLDDDNMPDDYFGNADDDVPLPFPLQTIVADPQTGLSLTLISALGVGSYAVVYLAKEISTETETLYALKCLGKDKLTEEEVAVQRNEVIIHAALPRHDNIIHLYNMFETSDHLFLLLEYSSGTDMYNWISLKADSADPISHSLLSATERFTVIHSVFCQVLEGVHQVHNCGVAHRDLKPENFMIEYRDGDWRVKITDFGLATSDQKSDEFECGSKPYMSYECRNGKCASYDAQKGDIWSLGIILINMLYHRCPWSDPCPRESTAFALFLQDRVDFLQRRFEDMPGSVARWLGLRAFAFERSGKNNKNRARPTIEEWKEWMKDFVPRMQSQIDYETESDGDCDDEEAYDEDEDLYLDDDDDMDYMEREVLGDEIVDPNDDNEDSDDQVVPIDIQSSSVRDQHWARSGYTSFDNATESRDSNLRSSSMPKYDVSSLSSFYLPSRGRNESWSDAFDMDDSEDVGMDFSAPILFEVDEDEGNNSEDEANRLQDAIDEDSIGMATAMPDDFFEPNDPPSHHSATPPTSSTELSFNSEKKRRPPNLRFDLDTATHNTHEILKRLTPNSSRTSPGLGDETLDLNPLLFIEPEQRKQDSPHPPIGSGISLASSMPAQAVLEASVLKDSNFAQQPQQPQSQPSQQQPQQQLPEQPMSQLQQVPPSQPQQQRQPLQQQTFSQQALQQSPKREKTLLKDEMKRPVRNLKEVKAIPFVFPPLKNTPDQPLKQKRLAPARAGDSTLTVTKPSPLSLSTSSSTTTGNTHSGATSALLEVKPIPYAAKRSPLGMAQPSPPTFVRQDGYVAVNQKPAPRPTSRHPNSSSSSWRKSHHRGSSWASIDDVWGAHRDFAKRMMPSTVSANEQSAEPGRLHPRFKESRGFNSTLPPAPPAGFSNSSGPGRGANSNLALIVGGPGAYQVPHARNNSNKTTSRRGHDNFNSQSPGLQSRQLLSYQPVDAPASKPPATPASEARDYGAEGSNQGQSNSKFFGKRNRSLIDLKALMEPGTSWRQPAAGGRSDPATVPTIPKIDQPLDGVHPLEAPIADSRGVKDSKVSKESQESTDQKDNVYHPPQWYDRRGGSSSQRQRPASGTEVDWSGWQKHNGQHRSRSISSQRTFPLSSGRTPAVPSPRMPLWTQQNSQNGQESSSSGPGGNVMKVESQHTTSGRAERVPTLEASRLDRAAPSSSGLSKDHGRQSVGTNLGGASSSTSTFPIRADGTGRRTDNKTESPLMTLTPPTPNVTVKENYFLGGSPLARDPSHSYEHIHKATITGVSVTTATTMTQAEGQGPEKKKVMGRGTMAGFGDMLRGFVAYNKNVKVGGESIGTDETTSTTRIQEATSDNKENPDRISKISTTRDESGNIVKQSVGE